MNNNSSQKKLSQHSILEFFNLGNKTTTSTEVKQQNSINKQVITKRSYSEIKKDEYNSFSDIPASLQKKKKVDNNSLNEELNIKNKVIYTNNKDKSITPKFGDFLLNNSKKNNIIDDDENDVIIDNNNNIYQTNSNIKTTNNNIANQTINEDFATIDLDEYSTKNIKKKLKENPHCFDKNLTSNINNSNIKYINDDDSIDLNSVNFDSTNKKNIYLNLKSNNKSNDKNDNDSEINLVSDDEKSPSSISNNKKNKKKKKKKKSELDQSDDDSYISNDDALQNEELMLNPQNKLPWFLKPENIKDINGYTPNDPLYDPTTLYVPNDFLTKLTPSMKQYWSFKQKNFDKVIFFKLGKFYELFYDDAIVGNSLLDLNWMGNDERLHVGFPEKVLEEKASILIENGYKVGVVEQTETIDQMKERTQNQSGNKNNKLVKRDLCNVFTKGTYINMDANNTKSKNNISDEELSRINNKYSKNKCCICLIYEEFLKNNNIIDLTQNSQYFQNNNNNDFMDSSQNSQNNNNISIHWGITIFDVTTLQFYIGQIAEDDDNSQDCNNSNSGNFSKIITLLYNIFPDEIIIIKNNLPEQILYFIKSLSCHPQITTLKNDYDIRALNSLMEKYFGDDPDKWNPVLLNPIYNKDKNKSTCMSIYFSIIYLEKILLAGQCLPTANYYVYNNDTDNNALNPNKKLIMDYQCINNLEILETKLDPKYPENGSLVEYLNKACTPFGKRMLKNWILSPLCDKNKINNRLNMLEDFLNNEDLLTKFRNSILKMPDLERQCSKFFKLAMNCDKEAIYFEDVTKNRLKEFFTLVNYLINSINVFDVFSDYMDKIKSDELRQILNINNNIENDNSIAIPNISIVLGNIIEDFHIKDNKDEKGNSHIIIECKPGVNKEIDDMNATLQDISDEFENILHKEKKRLKCPDISFAHTKCYKYELEIPEEYVKKNRPKEYILTTSKKGYLRFHTPEILENIKKLEETQEKLKTLQGGLNIELFKDFFSKKNIIIKYINCISELDCISTLAFISSYGKHSNYSFCRPEFVEVANNNGLPYIELHESVHPCLLDKIPYFVPNDIIIGKDNKTLIVITGPNMGGKSTLLRQVCISAIMAQIGCYVPAKQCKMSIIDRIFTRIGANDKILEGKSTFYVEMEETKNIIENATINSLVIMDELGRGTSTHDGKLIAKTILDIIEKKNKCRTLFTTHYHDIINWCQQQKGIDLFFMDSIVDENTKDISFLYKFKRGICPESYGISVAKLAGLPQPIIDLARKISEKYRKKGQYINLEKDGDVVMNI